MARVRHFVIHGRRWFDRRAGNTYHSVRIDVDGKPVAVIPFAYGYGQMYAQNAEEWLKRNGCLPGYPRGGSEPLRIYCAHTGRCRVTDTVVDVPRRRDLHVGIPEVPNPCGRPRRRQEALLGAASLQFRSLRVGDCFEFEKEIIPGVWHRKVRGGFVLHANGDRVYDKAWRKGVEKPLTCFPHAEVVKRPCTPRRRQRPVL